MTELSARRSGTNGPAEPFEGEFVSGNYFSTFGIGAFAGRTIAPADDRPGAAPVAVMSYRAWQEHFGLDPSVIGAASRSTRRPTRSPASLRRASSAIVCAPIRRIFGCPWPPSRCSADRTRY